MTEQTAASIYGSLYWNGLRGDSLPAGVDLSTFDFGVNAGLRRSAELLQEALGLPPIPSMAALAPRRSVPPRKGTPRH